MLASEGIKKALILSVLTTLFCVAMLTSVTYAWFTDDITSSNNKISSGSLDVDVEWAADGATFYDLESIDLKIYDNDNWMPGCERTDTFKIINNGTLDARYNMTFKNLIVQRDEDTGISLGDAIGVYIDGVYKTNLSRYGSGISVFSGTAMAESTVQHTVRLIYWEESDNRYGGIPLNKSNKPFDVHFAVTQTNNTDFTVTEVDTSIQTDYSYTISDNKATITGYNGAETQLEIPSRIGETPVTAINENAFKGNTQITSAILPFWLEGIGAYAFYGCSALERVTFQEKLTDIGEYAFDGCGALNDVVLPDGLKKLGRNSFSGCKSLTSIVIPEGITAIGVNGFANCVKLTSIELPSALTSIGAYAFLGSGLTSIDIPDTVGVIGIYAMSSTQLVKVKLPKSLITISDRTFQGCQKLQSVIIPSAVTTVSTAAFVNCSELTEVVFEDSEGWFSTESDGSLVPIDVTNRAANAAILKANVANTVWTKA